MGDLNPTSERSAWLQDANSILVSAMCHLVTLIALGLLTATSPEAWRGVKLWANIGDGLDTPADDSELHDALELQVAAESAALGPVQLFQDVAVATTDVSALEALAENSVQASGLEGLAMGGSGESDGRSGLAATEFFGIGGYGQCFVYVVDCSDSMNEKGKFERARYELLRSIEQLASDQRYFVIFYSDGAYPMDSGEPVPATQREIGRTVRWVNAIEASGGTNPLPALLYALSFEPDAIYFLSDGQFDPMAIHQLRARNGGRQSRQIPIHTIAFVERSTEGLMRTIARNSGGEFRFVK
jgi:hypothetical protein